MEVYESPSKKVRSLKEKFQKRGIYVIRCLKCRKHMLMNQENCPRCQNPNIFFSVLDNRLIEKEDVEAAFLELFKAIYGEKTA